MEKEIIRGRSLSFSYGQGRASPQVLKELDIDIYPGELVCILGANGSGKSSLVKHFNGLLALQGGRLRVAGIDLSDRKKVWQLRRNCGMVFQNPDNQFVSALVEEDIAFGLENYDTPREEINLKIREALSWVGLEGYEKRSTSSLSGGQKQLVALAGVLALSPELIIFDEVTSMLDPQGRQEVLESLEKLKKDNKTLIMITHFLDEALIADRVFIIKNGAILAGGPTRQILTDRELLIGAGLDLPFSVELYYELLEGGIRLARIPLGEEELVEELCLLK